jgi:hypothetical protein
MCGAAAARVVVKDKHAPPTERLVPISLVVETTPKHIELRCGRAELAKIGPFIEMEFIKAEVPCYGIEAVVYDRAFVVPEMEAKMVPGQHERIRPRELTMHRGAPLADTDGHLGKVDAFRVDPTDSHITRLVLREGHLWGQRAVSPPFFACREGVQIGRS